MSFGATLLAAAVEQIVTTFASELTSDIYEKLKGDPSKKAFELALGNALKRYAIGTRVPLIRPFLREQNSLLSDEVILAELSHVLRFESTPNYDLIGERWKQTLEQPPKWRNYSNEAQLLCKYLEEELRKIELFIPVFQLKTLSEIKATGFESTQALKNVQEHLTALTELLDTRLGELLTRFTQSSEHIQNHIRDYISYIEEKSRGFVGRDWVFNKVDEFIESHNRGYYFIAGDPGIGKSALASEMVKRHGHVHHFNVRAEITKPSYTFLENVCAQLVATYDLPYYQLPAGATQDTGFLNRLLQEVSDSLPIGERCIIVIDALDEGFIEGNPTLSLRLPVVLPDRVYIVATVRPDEKYIPRIEIVEQERYEIKADSSDNRKDIADFIRSNLIHQEIQAYIAQQKLTADEFVSQMVTLSEGNFMYLKYVLPQIRKGQYNDRSIKELPQGLRKYYREHWELMGMNRHPLPTDKINVVYALSAVKRPTSLKLIARYAQVDVVTTQMILSEWEDFIHVEMVDDNGNLVEYYRIYHASFREFLYDHKIIQAANMDERELNKRIGRELVSLVDRLPNGDGDDKPSS